MAIRITEDGTVIYENEPDVERELFPNIPLSDGTPEQITQAVNTWLEEHPEATTTVEDGSITRTKLDSNLQTELDSMDSEIGELKENLNEVVSTEQSLYKAAQRSGSDANYWDVGSTGNKLQANNEYIVKFMPNDTFTLDVIQIGTSASAAGMVDTIASGVSFSSGVEYSVKYTPSASNLRWIRVVSAATKFTSIGFYTEERKALAVLYSEEMTLSDADKSRARNNIDAASADDMGKVIDFADSVESLTAAFTCTGYFYSSSGKDIRSSQNLDTLKFDIPDGCSAVRVKSNFYASKIMFSNTNTTAQTFPSMTVDQSEVYLAPSEDIPNATTIDVTIIFPIDKTYKYVYVPHYVGNTDAVIVEATIMGDVSKLERDKVAAFGYIKKRIMTGDDIFDSTGYTSGYILTNATGGTTAYAGYAYTDYIDIEDTNFILEGASDSNACVLYNSGKTGLAFGLIKDYYDAEKRPNGTKYIRFNIQEASISSAKMLTYTYQYLQYITPEQVSSGKTDLYVGSEREFTSIRAAVEYANSIAEKYNVVNIYIEPGTYDIIGDYDLSEQAANWEGLTLADYVNLIGIGKPEGVILNGELPTDISAYAFERNNVSTINAWKNNNLKNLTITAKNMRYCWHNEDGKINAVEDAVEIVENCIFIYYENDTGIITSRVPVGVGASAGRKTIYRNCVFENQSANGNYPILIHNNTSAAKYCQWDFESCDFIGGTMNSLKLSSAGSGQIEIINIKGCRLPHSFRFDRQNVYQGTVCEYKVFGYGNEISGTISWDGVTEDESVLDMLLN